jgi:hypothetical protein
MASVDVGHATSEAVTEGCGYVVSEHVEHVLIGGNHQPVQRRQKARIDSLLALAGVRGLAGLGIPSTRL